MALTYFLDAISALFSRVAVGSVRFIFGMLACVLSAYTSGALLITLLAFALMTGSRIVISPATAMILVVCSHFCFFRGYQ
jgi:hypothetical protein